MLMIMNALLAAAVALPSGGLDWSSCGDELDRLRRAARDAAEKANEIDAKEDEYESCRNDLETFDLLGDGCRSARHFYESAIANFQTELDTVERRMRAVASSCGLGRAPAVPGRPSADPVCDVYKSYQGQLSMPLLMETCLKSQPEAFCRKCLEAVP
jgi:hypothetical protein